MHVAWQGCLTASFDLIACSYKQTLSWTIGSLPCFERADTDESPDGSGDAMRVTFEVHDGALVPVVYNYSHPVPLNELGAEVCGIVCGLDTVGKVGCRMISRMLVDRGWAGTVSASNWLTQSFQSVCARVTLPRF